MGKSLKNRGFTLVEMMVVVTFVGLLATIMLASYRSTIKKSRDNRRIADVTSIKQAANMYADRTGTFPSTGGGTVCSYTGGGGSCAPGACSGGGAINSWTALSNTLVDFINLTELKDPQLGSANRCYRYRSGGGNCQITYYSETAGGDTTITCK